MSWCDLPEFYKARWPKARKPHKCCECGQTIAAGERYCRVTGKWDGEVSTYSQHMECEDACRYLRDHNWVEECVPFGFLFDEVSQMNLAKDGGKMNEFRSLLARVKWLRKKGKRASFLPPVQLYQTSLRRLADDRARGWAD